MSWLDANLGSGSEDEEDVAFILHELCERGEAEALATLLSPPVPGEGELPL